MSKRIVCAFVALFILISSFALSGANFNFDDVIAEDIPSAQVHFADIPGKVDTLEADFALQAVNSQIGHDCYGGYVEPLYNAEGQAEYLLAEAEDGGYAIYHRVTGDLMELGEFGSSPYDGQTGKKYYFGPSNYAVKNNSETVDVMRNTVMDVEDLQTASSYMTSIRTEIVSKSEVKNYEEMLSSMREIRYNELSVQSIPEDGTVWSDNPYLDEVDIDDFTNVDDYELFTDARYVQTFGNNTHGSCIYVSTALLLRYADFTDNMGIIPNEKSKIPQMWKDFCENKTVQVADSVKLKDNQSPTYTCEIKKNDSAGEALHKFLIALDSPAKFGYTGWDVSKYAATITDCVSLTNTFNNSLSISDVSDIAQAQIYRSNPVAISIRYYDDEKNDKGGHDLTGHAIVAYGYYESLERMYFRTHFGWRNSSSIIVPDYYLSGDVNYLNVTTQHSENDHSCEEQKTIVLGGNTYTVDCFSKDGHQFRPHGLYHECACGEVAFHPNYPELADALDIGKVIGYGRDSSAHFCACDDCGLYFGGRRASELTIYEQRTDYMVDIREDYGWKSMYSLHKKGSEYIDDDKIWSVCDVCGEYYNPQCNHTYTYKQVSALQHRRTCSLCGKSSLEGHTYQNKVCIYCGRKKLL